jgi:hypothetical protein
MILNKTTQNEQCFLPFFYEKVGMLCGQKDTIIPAGSFVFVPCSLSCVITLLAHVSQLARVVPKHCQRGEQSSHTRRTNRIDIFYAGLRRRCVAHPIPGVSEERWTGPWSVCCYSLNIISKLKDFDARVALQRAGLSSVHSVTKI